MAQEVWKPFPDYEEHYEISNFGRVRRAKQTRGTQSGKILKLHVGTTGYMTTVLSKDYHKKPVLIHRAVARAFLTPVEGKDYVNHKDGNKTNNYVGNLEWTTPSENCLHSLYVLNGINSYGKLTEEQVIAIREDDRPQRIIARCYGLTQMAICQIKRGETYKQYGGPITLATRAAPHRLTEKEVMEIRASDKSGRELSEQYQVASSTISRIRRGQRRSVVKENKND